MARKTVTCTINGTIKEYSVDVRASLSDMLRGSAGLDSIKHGCDVGECGACTVLIDGKPFNSCIYLAIWAEGKTILTLEGLVDKKGTISDIQQAFIDEELYSVDFAHQGFIMSSIPIITSEEIASRDEIRKQVAGNLCRCTGYDKIINAIEKTQHKRIEEKKQK